MGKTFNWADWANIPQATQPTGPQSVAKGADWKPMPSNPQGMTVNPWQQASVEAGQQAAHQASQDAIGRREYAAQVAAAQTAGQAESDRISAGTFNNYKTDRELFGGASRGEFGNFTGGDKLWMSRTPWRYQVGVQ